MNFTRLNAALWKKTFAEAKWLLLACALTLFGFCWIRVWLVGRIDIARFKTLLDALREYEKFFPISFDQLATYHGRVAMTFEEPMLMFIMAIWAIARGSDSVSGELGRGTMEMLLAQPISRRQVLLASATVNVVGAIVLVFAALLGTWAGISFTQVKLAPETSMLSNPLSWLALPKESLDLPVKYAPMSSEVQIADMLPALGNFLAFGLFLAGLATLMSSCDRFRWRTIGIMSAFYVIESIIDILGKATDGLQWLQYFTFFAAHEPVRFVMDAWRRPDEAWSFLLLDADGAIAGLGPMGFNLLLGGLGLLCFAGAFRVFCRRDLPAPL